MLRAWIDVLAGGCHDPPLVCHNGLIHLRRVTEKAPNTATGLCIPTTCSVVPACGKYVIPADAHRPDGVSMSLPVDLMDLGSFPALDSIRPTNCTSDQGVKHLLKVICASAREME